MNSVPEPSHAKSPADSGLSQADWPWWWSTDEERYSGPCGSRADAIMEAFAEGNLGAHVMQAVHGDIHTQIYDADQLAEQFDEQNYDVADGDGDPLSAMIPADGWKSLADTLERRLKALIHKHGVRAWGFSAQTKGEWVNLAPAALASLPPEAQQIIADLANGWQESWGVPEHYAATQMERLRIVLTPVPVAKPTPDTESGTGRLGNPNDAAPKALP